ncbi:uncharacterized protein LOC116308523 [Actinia tenebrosa]|uniref:Uncharacterized protein LOC116308523 n=1 Tax=Actinia tenebrosa TaxID=6105 RepID=A0A6P8JAT2_ACTTE|nr:uncharacterized protein LOC116308523 [Actinia tenebrosa]
MNYTSCPPVVMPSHYSQELLRHDYILKIVSCTILVLLTIPVSSLNMLVILTVIKTPKLQTPSFILICSLAMTDFGSGLAAFPINASWRLVELVDRDANICSTFDVGFAIAFTLLSSSELTVTALSIDRYLAIHLSQRYRNQVTNRRVVIVVVVLWCIAVVWGVSSVFITPKVLHTTVVFVGILTFGAIFLCYALAFKALLGQEAMFRKMNRQQQDFKASKSALTSEKETPQELLTTSPPCQQTKRRLFALHHNSKRKKSLQINIIKTSPSKGNEDAVENEDLSTCFASLQSDLMTQDKKRAPEDVKQEFEETRIEHFHKSRHLCKTCIPDDKDVMLSVIDVSKFSKDNVELTDASRNGKESNCSISICVTNSYLKPESKTTSFKGSVDNNSLKTTEDHNYRQKRFSYLRNKMKMFRSGAGASVRLVKYRYTIVTLLWVISMLILCYAPYFFLSFMVAFTGMTNEGAVAWSIAITVMCINSLINPVIYLWRLRALRKACLNILKGICC